VIHVCAKSKRDIHSKEVQHSWRILLCIKWVQLRNWSSVQLATASSLHALLHLAYLWLLRLPCQSISIQCNWSSWRSSNWRRKQKMTNQCSSKWMSLREHSIKCCFCVELICWIFATRRILAGIYTKLRRQALRISIPCKVSCMFYDNHMAHDYLQRQSRQ